jgi:hypothetical protein
MYSLVAEFFYYTFWELLHSTKSLLFFCRSFVAIYLIFLFYFHIQEEYQKLDVHAFNMETEISSLQEALTTSIAEKDEALSKVELMTSELEDLANKLNSSELERNSLSDQIALLVYKMCLCDIFDLIAVVHPFSLLTFSIMKLSFCVADQKINCI